tara:strand:- start:25945 stop:26118 length:174 start_codon:yes stop_codon:yes gene_type:complete
MASYTDKLKTQLDRVILRGSPDKETIRSLAEIIFELNDRINKLEKTVILDETIKQED